MMPKHPVMRYYGGKWKLAPWIISYFPTHRTYVEPFGGAASVLLRKPRSYAEVYNDAWHAVVTVFQVIRDPIQAHELERRIRLTPFAREEFEQLTDVAMSAISDPIELARCMIFRSYAGFGSGAVSNWNNTGFRSNTTRAYSTPADNWREFPDVIRALTDRLQGVIIERDEAENVIARYDNPQTLYYLDPPYVQSTRYMKRGSGYVHELTEADHRQLALKAHEVAGMVIISGYRCELYDELYGDWRRYDTLAMADGARERTESLWLSPSAETSAPRLL